LINIGPELALQWAQESVDILILEHMETVLVLPKDAHLLDAGMIQIVLSETPCRHAQGHRNNSSQHLQHLADAGLVYPMGKITFHRFP
jgi:hypothetical protein